jgi:putative DNA primase/helicase
MSDRSAATSELPELPAAHNGGQGADPGAPGTVGATVAHLTDLGNARRFAVEHEGHLRYVREGGKWLSWGGTRWRPDATGDAERAAKATARALLKTAGQQHDDAESNKTARWALASQSHQRLQAMLSQATTEPEIATAQADIDRDPWLLVCANGTLDLRTGVLRNHDPADLITRGTDIAYDQHAACPRWTAFLGEIFADDGELIEFVRRFVGYCLTGDTREHLLAVLYGRGSNGKSTFLGVLEGLLGDFAVPAAFDAFTKKPGARGATNDLAALHRARLVSAVESTEGQKLDEATVKLITGGDRISVRFLYAEFFQLVPEFKLMLVTNHRPRVDADDDAIWRRLRLVPFEQSFEGREDRGLKDTLRLELPGILAWAVKGCLAWQRDGLGTAAAVTRATTAYRAEEDALGGFIEECCDLGDDYEIARLTLREEYEAYCRDVGARPLGASLLGRHLAERGIKKGQRPDGLRVRIYRGIRLRSADPNR